MRHADRAIALVTHIHTKWFRPPYGLLSDIMQRELTKEKYTTVMWNTDPRDWDYGSSTSAHIEEYIFNHEQPIMVIILHDGRDIHINYPRDNTVGALAVVIEKLKKQGYTFVTINELSSTTIENLKN